MLLHTWSILCELGESNDVACVRSAEWNISCTRMAVEDMRKSLTSSEPYKTHINTESILILGVPYCKDFHPPIILATWLCSSADIRWTEEVVGKDECRRNPTHLMSADATTIAQLIVLISYLVHGSSLSSQSALFPHHTPSHDHLGPIDFMVRNVSSSIL